MRIRLDDGVKALLRDSKGHGWTSYYVERKGPCDWGVISMGFLNQQIEFSETFQLEDVLIGALEEKYQEVISGTAG